MIKRNSGFTLVEVMIAAAVMAGLSLVGMQMMKSQTKQTTKASFDSEALLITNEIIGLLTDPDKCLTTFGPAGTKSALSTAPGVITAINTDRYYTLPTIADGGLAPNNGYGNAAIQIVSYELSSTVSELQKNYAYLTIKYQNKQILKSTAGTPVIVPRVIKLYVEVTNFAGGNYNIEKCRSLSAAYSEIWQRNLTNQNLIYYGGYVGIGTTTPEYLLHLANTAPYMIYEETDTTQKFYSGVDGSGFWVREGTTANPDLFTIRNTGNVGIGTTTPAQKLEVAGGLKVANGEPTAANVSASGLSFDGDTGVFSPSDGNLHLWSNNVRTVSIFGNNVGIGTAINASYVVNILGNTNTQGTVYGTEFAATSDRNAKANIKKLNNSEAFKKVNKLSPVSFTWKHNQSKDMGFIAQEVEAIFPEFVLHNADGTYSLKYNSLTGPIVASIQHLRDENEKLKGQVKALQDENKAILIELKKINSRLERKSGQIIRP